MEIVSYYCCSLLFAGNLSGTTQTMPLAIFSALESNVNTAIVLSMALLALAVLLVGASSFLWRGTR